ncbi:NADH-quinone oxidoreductase subunit NuoK [Alicyclobacillus macrosporangiidus]|uniref:NADH-quinone oxidoreductase subunit K n=1 Tax=Alicyclobacillus macrosporangiidus TaxID=392015 RepID=A0A1I7HXB5_9BACL|nr:NADH-quinone oxidoreductase subunit NuoK [Alicyclobacillus macrosporangiidus]SFU65289.1 NADH-quinone oxidoreductase subunit K [Alicyclobacillus macrosporangiidus]
MFPIPTGSLLALGAILFCIGLYGALTKRNLIIVLVSIELMLNAANINLVTFSRLGVGPNISGQVFALFTITVAAAEIAVGLALLLAIFRVRKTTEVQDLNVHKH